MSAEKEIVNNWLNSKGFFTINNVKISGNKDLGILAIRKNEVWHVETIVSVSGIVADTGSSKKTVNTIFENRFNDKTIETAVKSQLNETDAPLDSLKRILVLGGIPISRKKEIIEQFKSLNVEVLEFEQIISSVMQKMDTSYFKNDVIRTLQLVKYLLLSNPFKLADLLGTKGNILNSSTRGRFIRNLLEQELMKREFSKADQKHMVEILKYSRIKPDVLAQMLEKEILTSRTRKPFIKSLIEQEKTGRIYKKETEVKPKEKSLSRFF